MAIKNWAGMMRPDDPVWMRQLNYLKNNRHTGNGRGKDDPIRTEPLHNGLLTDLTSATQKERKTVCRRHPPNSSSPADRTSHAA